MIAAANEAKAETWHRIAAAQRAAESQSLELCAAEKFGKIKTFRVVQLPGL